MNSVSSKIYYLQKELINSWKTLTPSEWALLWVLFDPNQICLSAVKVFLKILNTLTKHCSRTVQSVQRAERFPALILAMFP